MADEKKSKKFPWQLSFLAALALLAAAAFMLFPQLFMTHEEKTAFQQERAVKEEKEQEEHDQKYGVYPTEPGTYIYVYWARQDRYAYYSLEEWESYPGSIKSEYSIQDTIVVKKERPAKPSTPSKAVPTAMETTSSRTRSISVIPDGPKICDLDADTTAAWVIQVSWGYSAQEVLDELTASTDYAFIYKQGVYAKVRIHDGKTWSSKDSALAARTSSEKRRRAFAIKVLPKHEIKSCLCKP